MYLEIDDKVLLNYESAARIPPRCGNVLKMATRSSELLNKEKARSLPRVAPTGHMA